MDSIYTSSLGLIALGIIIIATLAIIKKYYNSSDYNKRENAKPIPFRNNFRMMLFGYSILLLGIITLIMKLLNLY